MMAWAGIYSNEDDVSIHAWYCILYMDIIDVFLEPFDVIRGVTVQQPLSGIGKPTILEYALACKSLELDCYHRLDW